MARPKKNNADYFSHDNSMRNHRKVKALRAEFGAEGFSAYVMLLETLTEADNFQLEIKKELDWKLLAGDFGIETEKLKNIFTLMEELELIEVKNNIIVCNSLKDRLEPLLAKREKDREYASDKNRNEKGQFNGVIGTENRVIATKTPVIATETPQSKVNKSKVNNIYNGEQADKSAIDKKPLNDYSIQGSVDLKDLYKKMGMKVSSCGVQQWQDEAYNAFVFFGSNENERARIFKCYRDNQQVARTVLTDCKELEKPHSLYFFKVYNETLKKQKENKSLI